MSGLKKLLVLGVIILGIFVISVFINMATTPKSELETADVIIAISGGDTEARTKEAINLYGLGLSSRILFSGAALDPLSPSNAEVMKSIAKDAGVPEEHIIIEEKSKTTEENALKSEFIIEEYDFDKVILVTSPYHQRRAAMEFQDKLGQDVQIINYSSEDNGWSNSWWWLTPKGWFLAGGETLKTAITVVKNL